MSWDKFYFSFTGRINRASFGLYMVGSGAFLLILIGFVSYISDPYGYYVASLLLPLFYINSAVTVKRLHDINQPGWLLACVLIAFVVGFIAVVSDITTITKPDLWWFSETALKRSLVTSSCNVCGCIIGAALPIFALPMFFCCFFLKGTDGKNRYGDPP